MVTDQLLLKNETDEIDESNETDQTDEKTKRVQHFKTKGKN